MSVLVARGFPGPWLVDTVEVGTRPSGDHGRVSRARVSGGPGPDGELEPTPLERELLRDFPATDKEREMVARTPGFSGSMLWANLARDVFVAGIILVAMGAALEWVARRRREE